MQSLGNVVSRVSLKWLSIVIFHSPLLACLRVSAPPRYFKRLNRPVVS